MQISYVKILTWLCMLSTPKNDLDVDVYSLDVQTVQFWLFLKKLV